MSLLSIYSTQYFILDCGRLKPKLLILNGTPTSSTSVPWNVAVYSRKNNYNDYELICGGTLIAPNLVVSGNNSKLYIL